MILYFADRKLNIIGQVSTNLPKGLTVYDDLKTEDIESGVASFECRIPYDKKTRKEVENFTAVGNYILRSNGDENEFYTIIDSESNTRDKEVYVYAEDAGLDLLNEVFGDYAADKAYPISHYVNMFIYDTGFEIGLNEIPNLTRKLSWEGEATATERIASAATQFDGCEISYSFKVENLTITHKYINIHKQRGKDAGVQLRLNKEVDRIITKQSIANLATAFYCKGGTPEDENTEDNIEPVPITLNGYKYDDGDFYVDGGYLKSRKAVQKWSRYIWNKEPNKVADEGHIVKLYEYDTLSQSELCAHAVTELKKASQIEVNYEVDINRLPKGVKIGDRVNIIDDEIGLYVSARILMFETSVVDQEQKATIGEYLIKSDGIAQKVEDMAAEFAKLSVSAQRAKKIAQTAQKAAETANTQAQTALQSAQEAQTQASEAKQASETATQSAEEATQKANEAKQAVEGVQQDVADMEQTIADAEAAAEQARQAAETAQTKAEEAHTAAVNAGQQAQTAEQKANEATEKANEAIEKGNTAENTAQQAQQQAVDASTTALAAKQDAEKAQEDIDALGEGLTTLEETMTADYARKSELTESEAHLQAQITKNAAEIKTTVAKVQVIDETTNDAAIKAQAAYYNAQQAQEEAQAAQLVADEAQATADEAQQAYENAQAQADIAKTAADTAQSVLDEANAELAEAEADLATIQGRADATEAEIADAQARVEDAQNAATLAQADAEQAIATATEAQQAADDALAEAEQAQIVAQTANAQATIAQKAVEAVSGSATAEATRIANEAKEAATNAQATADNALAEAEQAQQAADDALVDALEAQEKAEAADALAEQKEADLKTAQENLAEVLAKAEATEEEIAEAQALVDEAQAAADKALQDATSAQKSALEAKRNAETAQSAADNAQAKADEAQQAADDAQAAADKAQEDVDALAVRVTKTETDIQQTSEQIALLATKEEVTQTLGGYYTKDESDANLTVKANEINASVTQKIAEIEVGGRNLLENSALSQNLDKWETIGAEITEIDGVQCAYIACVLEDAKYVRQNVVDKIDAIDREQQYVYSVDIRLDNFIKGTTSPYIAIYFSGQYTKEDGAIGYANATTVSGNPLIAPHNGAGWVRLEWVLTFPYEFTILNCSIYAKDVAGDLYFKNAKLEKGNKATDWTPAPEDVDADIAETSSTLHAEIVEQTTQILVECDKMLFTALESYVANGDYESFKESIQSQLEILTDNITMTFTQTQEALNAVNEDLQEKFNQVTTYFTFDIDGLIIGKTDNPYKMVLSNERYSMTVNDEEVMYIDAVTKMAYFPKLTITDAFVLLGYEWKHGEVDGLVIVDWIGGV